MASITATNLISPKQQRSLIESNAKINIWEGSVRSGKTYISLWRFLKELIHGKEGEYAIITRTYDSFKRNLLPLFVDMIGSDARYYIGKREINIWEKTVHVIGADDESAEAKIRGPTFQGAYVDEASIIPESVFKMLVSRCAMGDAKIFATTNPDSPFHWLKTGFLDGNPDVIAWQFRLDDNPKLTVSEQEYLRRQYKGLWYQRFIEGLWVQAEGAVYDFFSEALHIIESPRSNAESYIVGCDYGTTNPCAFVLIGINLSSFPHLWVESEYYYNSRLKQRQKTDSEYASDLRSFIEGKHVSAIYLDPSAASFRIELRKQGVENIFEAKNEVIDGIRLVSDFMNKGKLKIVARCKNLIHEFQSYVWDPKSVRSGIDKPLKENDHALDALRYAIYTHFFARAATKIDWEGIHAEVVGGKTATLPRFFQQPVMY